MGEFAKLDKFFVRTFWDVAGPFGRDIADG
jgi:hypothetical protein